MPLLEDNPDTADLREKVAAAWREFTHGLAEAVAALPDGATLEIVLDPTASGTGNAAYSVTATATDGRLVARAIGNASLPPEYRMNRTAVAEMVALGWSPPGVDEGSGTDFGLTVDRVDGPAAQRLATLLTRTLRDVYGAPHPAFLVYTARDGAQRPVSVPALGTARAVEGLPGAASRPPAPEHDAEADAAALREQVRAVLAAMYQTSPDRLNADPDGDIGIRAGSAMVFVKVRERPPVVDVLSPILTQVRPSERLYGRLSELTNRMPVGRLYCADDTVWASIPVFGRNFQPSHLILAVQVMTSLADELDDRLLGEFGGRRFFDEGNLPSHPPEPAGTGMYL
ncbi:MAG: hypothetical protein FWJ70_01740 [Micromonosporaceae bacterium]|jgi:hypothetical protein